VFNIGTFELVALAVIALLVFGPEKLPKVAADAARLLRELRTMASGARRELSEALGPEFDEFKNLSNLSDLNPRTFVKKNLLDVLDDDDTSKGSSVGSPGAGSGGTTSSSSGPDVGSANRGSGRSVAPDATPPRGPSQGFDADTT
jgi:sec-independent protein translocase protein TatB